MGISRKKPVYSKETLEKKRAAIKKVHELNRGRKLSEEHKANLKKNHVGSTGKKLSKEHLKKLMEGRRKKPRKGFKLSEEHKAKISKANSNPSLKTRKKKSASAKARVAKGTHNFYKGGVTEINKKIRNSSEYKLWRTAVFERDNYTCVWCGLKSQKGVKLEIQADHIKPFSLFPELRFAIDNGRTLCRDCHKKTDTFGWNLINKK